MLDKNFILIVGNIICELIIRKVKSLTLNQITFENIW